MKMPSIRALALCLMVAAGHGCGGDPSEAQLVAALDAMQEAGEARDVPALMEGVAEDFSGNGGEFDQRALALYLRGVALRHQSIGVTRLSTAIEMHGESALVRLRILVTGGRGGVLPESGQLYEVESSWRHQDGAWQLVSASWKPAS